MFGVGLGEIVVILLVALVVAGPERLPGLAKQAGELVRTVRKMADNARDDLRSELGPEYADLELRDLDPRTMVRKHLSEAWQAGADEDDSPGADDAPGRNRSVLPAGERPPFDTEAT